MTVLELLTDLQRKGYLAALPGGKLEVKPAQQTHRRTPRATPAVQG